MPGYSGTPLARKLGIAAGMRVRAVGAPPEYRAWLEPTYIDPATGKMILSPG